jgi:myo-inositol-1(or 4)-monophosphatase
MVSMKPAELDRRFAAAEAVVREAGALALELRGGPLAGLGVEEKGKLDLVTAGDRAIEKLIIEKLGGVFGDAVLGEEFGGEPADRLWVVDPIDGTFNYIHGLPHWAISLAFVVGGKIRLGFVYNPARDEFFAARRGGGAFLNGTAIETSGAANLDRPLVELGRSSRDTVGDYSSLLRRVVEGGCEFRRLGSAALGLAWVACGRTDAYYQREIHAWDVLAGLLIAEEAGAWTNDFLANDGLRRGNPVFAAAAPLKEKLAALVGL